MIEYQHGMLDKFKANDDPDLWHDFPDLMLALGFKMDCEQSFNEYASKSPLKLKKANSQRDEFSNNLYLLEHADRQIVGNYLFSYWRYLTHWSCGYGPHDVGYLNRIIDILESKYHDDPGLH